MSWCKGKEIVWCPARRSFVRKKTWSPGNNHLLLSPGFPKCPKGSKKYFKRKYWEGDKKEKGTTIYLFKRCSFLWTSEIRKAVMNYRRIQGGQERSQTNEHGGNCDLSIASNLQMNNSKISVLRWSKVSKKLHFYKFIEKETYLLCQTKRSTLKQGS